MSDDRSEEERREQPYDEWAVYDPLARERSSDPVDFLLEEIQNKEFPINLTGACLGDVAKSDSELAGLAGVVKRRLFEPGIGRDIVFGGNPSLVAGLCKTLVAQVEEAGKGLLGSDRSRSESTGPVPPSSGDKGPRRR